MVIWLSSARYSFAHSPLREGNREWYNMKTIVKTWQLRDMGQDTNTYSHPSLFSVSSALMLFKADVSQTFVARVCTRMKFDQCTIQRESHLMLIILQKRQKRRVKQNTMIIKFFKRREDTCNWLILYKSPINVQMKRKQLLNIVINIYLRNTSSIHLKGVF